MVKHKILDNVKAKRRGFLELCGARPVLMVLLREDIAEENPGLIADLHVAEVEVVLIKHNGVTGKLQLPWRIVVVGFEVT